MSKQPINKGATNTKLKNNRPFYSVFTPKILIFWIYHKGTWNLKNANLALPEFFFSKFHFRVKLTFLSHRVVFESEFLGLRKNVIFESKIVILKYELSFSARNCHFSSKSPLKVWIVIFESILSFSIQSVLSKCDFRIKIVNSPSQKFRIWINLF